MSSASDLLTPASVLRYTATGPAVPVPRHPSDDELAFDWTLSARDIRLSLMHRGQENLCRFAVQLCGLRKHGRLLTTYAHLSPVLLEYLCRQLDLPLLTALATRTRDNTESDYQREIAQYLGWRPFDAAARTWVRDWVVAQVAQHLCVGNLVEQVEALRRAHRIVLPGPAALARTVNAAYAHAEHLLFHWSAMPRSARSHWTSSTTRASAPNSSSGSARRRRRMTPGSSSGLRPINVTP